MNKITRLLSAHPLTITCSPLPLLVAAALVLTGCSSTKTKVDRGPVSARTFSFIAPGSKPVPDYADNRQLAHAMVQQAIIKNLAAKGVSQVGSGGDITVGYLIIVGNNAATTSLNSYFGDTSDTEALMEKVHKEQTQADTHRGYFEAGTLVIDFVDPKSSKTLQRRTIQGQILRNLTVETRTARIQGIVDEALADLRISN